MPAASHPAARDARPREMILTFYGLYRDVIRGWISIAHLIRLMADVDVDAPAVRSAVSRLKRRGLIEARTVAGAAGYSLSPDGQRLLAEGDPRIFGRQPSRLSDGWVLAVFSVPEAERGKRHVLRSRLDQLGFGSAAPGVWIAPQHLAGEARHRIGTLGLAGYAELFEGARMPGTDLRTAAGQWWDLAGLAGVYTGFCAAHEPVLRRWSRQRRPGDPAAFTDYMRAVDSWRKIVYRDPRLPAELLPADWPGNRAERIFFGLHAALRETAEKHVLTVLESM
ncbi:MAG TPA: PaaX family transcriptional regulator C-terminal domain-containing protein [Streptosporangiaceae bacterium]|nr:PaaX family transcriptional regulator C-terminal domain-containing protein [Streptosporangiaceae bacterium]